MVKAKYSKLADHEENTKSKLCLFSNITYSWLTPLFKTAFQRPLKSEDLPEPFGLKPSKLIFEKYHKNWKAEQKTKNPKLWRAVLKSMDWPILLTNLACSFLGSFCEILLPVLLFLLLKECNDSEQHNSKFSNYTAIIEGNHTTLQNTSPFITKVNLSSVGIYIVAISFVSFCVNTFLTETINIGSIQGAYIQSGIISLIYHKVISRALPYANDV